MVSNGEQEMIEQLCMRFSCNASELIRGYIRDQHKKVFPAYGARKINLLSAEVLTNEQFCESYAGKVEKQGDGGSVCVLKTPGGLLRVPLSDRERIEQYAKQFELI
jgi:hypothetical protein